jgi:hypothetical protein
MKKRAFDWLFTIAVLILSNGISIAQCAMCKSTVESGSANGESMARGLNTGILYLMAIPYVILMLGTYFFFKKPIDEKLKSLRNRYFPSTK